MKNTLQLHSCWITLLNLIYYYYTCVYAELLCCVVICCFTTTAFPTASILSIPDQTTVVGTSVRVRCSGSGDPELSFMWFKVYGNGKYFFGMTLDGYLRK